MYLNRQACANSVDPDEMPGLHCFPLIQQFLDTAKGSKLYLFTFQNKYGKETICMKYQGLFSGKNKKNVISLPSADSAQRVVNSEKKILHELWPFVILGILHCMLFDA